jgi:hypothetical protein
MTVGLLQAMGAREGYNQRGISPDRPQRNNSPGDLLWCPEAREFGATHGDPTYAVFPDIATGWLALRRWLSVPARFDSHGVLVGGYLGATLAQVVYRFAPPGTNDSASYLAYVCAQTGIEAQTKLSPELLAVPAPTPTQTQKG